MIGDGVVFVGIDGTRPARASTADELDLRLGGGCQEEPGAGAPFDGLA
jgi:hypothetical protein